MRDAVRADPEALSQLAQATQTFGLRAGEAVSTATHAFAHLEGELDRVVSARRADVDRARSELAAAEAALRACLQSRERNCSGLSQRVSDCTRTLERMIDRLNRATAARTGVAVAQSRHTSAAARFQQSIAALVPRGVAELNRLGEHLDGYRAVPVPEARSISGGGAAPTVGVSELSGAGTVAAGGLTPIGTSGAVSVPLDLTDDGDSPVASPQDFSKRSYAELRRGLEMLEEVVLPGVRNGATADDFSRRDAREGRAAGSGYRSVHDAFFGSTSVKLSHSSNGRYTVDNGYHRIYAARQLGLDSIPARVS